VPEQKRIALLIDCDNVSHNSIEGVLEELAKYGMVNVRHAHGDWNNPSLSGWADKLHPHAIRPMQQFAYTKGKNATDSAMIIDAMDLLYSGSIDAFALMTSDSDFTPLVLRILESGLPVYGFGKNKNEIRMDTLLVRLLRTAVEQTSDDDGWADMSKVGSYINNNSSFSSINYGYKKLGDLVRASELFNIEMRRDGKAMFIKDVRK
jgi:uncharacterized protein (TIGR00288 family)